MADGDLLLLSHGSLGGWTQTGFARNASVLLARRHCGSRHMQATVGPPEGAANSPTCTKPRRS